MTINPCRKRLHTVEVPVIFPTDSLVYLGSLSQPDDVISVHCLRATPFGLNQLFI